MRVVVLLLLSWKIDVIVFEVTRESGSSRNRRLNAITFLHMDRTQYPTLGVDGG